MKKTVRTIATYIFAAVLAVFCLFTVSAESFLYARAESRAGDSIETSDPLEDLEGAVIGGKQFSLDNYTWDLNGVPQLIYFAEVGYSMWTDNREDYALYAYIYNPAGLFFDEGSESNKIELAFGSGGYEKYPLEMIGKSQRPGYEGLFYKAEIVLSRSQREEAFGNLSSNERVYTITSMELSAGGRFGRLSGRLRHRYAKGHRLQIHRLHRRLRFAAGHGKFARLHGGRIQRSSGSRSRADGLPSGGRLLQRRAVAAQQLLVYRSERIYRTVRRTFKNQIRVVRVCDQADTCDGRRRDVENDRRAARQRSGRVR